MKYILFFLLIVPLSVNSQTPVERLEQSPRHHEWVSIANENREVKGFLVYPEVADNVPVIVVIHENRGLNDWARSMADQIAEAGYIALAPDLLSGTAPNGGGTESFENSDKARTGIYSLDPEQVTADLKATVAYSKNIAAANGKIAVIGFCWGGSQSFRFASNSDAIETAIVCYGTGPKEEELYASINIPIYGFYGGNDNRVNATISQTQKTMEALGKYYEPIIYSGAGHGFFRAGESPNASEENKKARVDAWKRLKKILAKI